MPVRTQSARPELAKALVSPAQRTAVAMEIEKDGVSLARRHVPDDHALAVGGVEHRLFRLRQANRPRAVRWRSGKYWNQRCAR